MTIDVFGTIKSADALEAAALATLEMWFNTYLREMEYQNGITPNSLISPMAYISANTIDRESSNQLPTIVAISPGFSGKEPYMTGDGLFKAFFSIGIGAFVSADNRINTMRLVRLYTAVARTIMIQKGSLGGFANGTVWLDESYYPDFDFTDTQTIGVGQAVFEVEVEAVAAKYAGPKTPDTAPGTEWPYVQTVNVTVGRK